jgi:glycosyltransferase involved in cell wall biosynthesis
MNGHATSTDVTTNGPARVGGEPRPRTGRLIVIPAYNEEAALAATVERLQALPDGFEILIVNDGSRDRTLQVAKHLSLASRLPLHVVSLTTNWGIGMAVQTGYLFARQHDRYQYVIQFDADGQHPPEALVELVEACERQGLDLCIGSRFLGNGDGFQSTALRRVGIRFFINLIGLLTHAPITDPTSGLRCAGPRAWESFAASYPEDYPEPESLFWCLRNGLRVAEIPVTMHERQGGVSSIRSWKPVYYMLKVTLAIMVESIRKREVAR